VISVEDWAEIRRLHRAEGLPAQALLDQGLCGVRCRCPGPLAPGWGAGASVQARRPGAAWGRQPGLDRRPGDTSAIGRTSDALIPNVGVGGC
jgi:hypothetical protein